MDSNLKRAIFSNTFFVLLLFMEMDFFVEELLYFIGDVYVHLRLFHVSILVLKLFVGGMVSGSNLHKYAYRFYRNEVLMIKFSLHLDV